MNTSDYTLDANGRLHDSKGRFVNRAAQMTWCYLVAQQCLETLAALMPKAPVAAPPVKLWKVEERRLTTAKAFGW